MTIAELRRLAEQLPAGVSLTLDRATLLEVLPEDAATVHSVATLATQLKRSPSTVRGWLQAGLFPGAYQLPGTKRPGAWRIPPAAVEAFIGRQGSRAQETPGSTIAPRKAARPCRTSAGGGNLGAWRAARPAVSSPRSPS